MDETEAPTEQEPRPRRVSRQHQVDRALRERRRELVATMLLSRTSYRKMVELLRQPEEAGGLAIETSITTIASDVAVIRSRWRNRMVEDFSGHVSEQMAYYDALLRALTPRALSGNHNAVVDLLGVLDRRARLLQMEAPDRLLVGITAVDGSAAVDVAERWGGAPREEQVARTEQILSILHQAEQLRLPGGPPLLNPQSEGATVIDLPVPEE